MRECWRRVLSFVRRPWNERDLAEEMRFHLQCAVEENRDAGMTETDALRAAHRRFGDTFRFSERVSDVWGWAVLDRWRQDLRWAFRTLGRNPGFTAAAVVTIAMGIGANAAIFSVVNAVLMRPLPYAAADRLVEIFQVSPVFGRSEASQDVFQAWAGRAHALEAVAAFGTATFAMAGEDGAERVAGGRVTPGFFDVLGVGAFRGRLFRADDVRAGAAPVAVLRYETWQRRFGGRGDAIGEHAQIGGTLRTIVGVLPPGFRFETLERGSFDEPAPTEIWTPLALTATGGNASSRYDLCAVGRLRPGITAEQARAELVSLTSQVTSGESSADCSPLKDELVKGARRTLLLLFAAVAAVLLIACANIAHLQLARGMARGREMAIRIAVGAGRARLVRQLLVEALVVAGLGALAGLVGARWSLGALVALAGPDLPRGDQVRVDPAVLAFTAAAAVASALVFGLLPALRVSSADPNLQLNGGDSSRAGVRANTRFTRLLVASEIGLALVLLVCAGLMLSSLWHAENVNLGFSTERLVAMRVAPGRKSSNEQRARLFADALSAIRALPGVESADAVNTLPMGGSPTFQGFRVAGAEMSGAALAKEASQQQYRLVTPGYFRTLRIPLLRGRVIADADDASAPCVAVVNRTAERRYFQGDAVGRRIVSGDVGEEGCEVVGVVGDIRHQRARSAPLPEVYYPLAQDAGAPQFQVWVVVKTAGDPAATAAAIRGRVSAIDRTVVVDRVRTMEARRQASLGVSSFLAYLLIGFAGLALLLAIVGDYGVVSYSVARRTREIGVRLALGASRSAVVWMILRETLVLAVLALAIAVPIAQASSRLLAGYLFEVTPTDPTTLAAAAATVLAAAVLAAALPARRASRIEAVTALRCE